MGVASMSAIKAQVSTTYENIVNGKKFKIRQWPLTAMLQMTHLRANSPHLEQNGFSSLIWQVLQRLIKTELKRQNKHKNICLSGPTK